MQLVFPRRFLVCLAVFLLAVVFVGGGLVWFFGLPLEAWYYARRIPVLRETPAPVRDEAITESSGRTITFCGSEFDVPWNDLNDAKTKSGGNSTTLYFESGLVALVKCLPPREFVAGVLSSIKVSPKSFGQAFGDSALESDYALWRIILETTPDALNVRTPHRQQGALMALLVLKAMATPRADSGMFSIHGDGFDGFQYQDPQSKTRPDWVLMDLFAKDRGLEFQFFLNYHGASPHVSQADINRIVRTVRKVAPPYPPLKQASLTPSRN
ncbi:MAG: hypothetical protein WAK27_13850 [Candidatus Sulfotelmatobacter sp.]|jgi:hypothetical protein